MITTQFIKDETGKKLAVILPMEDYENVGRYRGIGGYSHV